MANVAGRLAGVYLGKKKGEGKTAVESAELIREHGLSGDSHAGSNAGRQVSLFALEVLRQIQEEGIEATPEELSANLFTENIRLDSLKPGSQLRIGETLIEIVEARKPCRSITRIDNRLPKRLYRRCGQLGRIIQGGTVRTGDVIEVINSSLPYM